jgi:hypothetical protein
LRNENGNRTIANCTGRAQKWKLVIEVLIASRKLHEVNGVLLAVVESKQEFRQMDLFGG